MTKKLICIPMTEREMTAMRIALEARMGIINDRKSACHSQQDRDVYDEMVDEVLRLQLRFATAWDAAPVYNECSSYLYAAINEGGTDGEDEG